MLYIGKHHELLHLQIEYLACTVAGECWDLIKEFAQGFMGESLEVTTHLKGRRMELYEPTDTMKQYLEHYLTISKANIVNMQQQQSQQQVPPPVMMHPTHAGQR